VQHYKRDLAGLPLRKAAFAGPDALCAAVA
jgi:hypothetical protein